MDEEKIIIDIPSLPQGADISKSKRGRFLPSAVAVLLILISFAVHSVIITKAVCYMKEEGESFLFSFVVPDSKISAPTEPPLPDDTTLHRGDGSTDKQSSFITKTEDLSTGAEYGLAITNETAYNPDLYYLLGADPPSLKKEVLDKKYGQSSPKVLIYHTHATEAYADTHRTGFRTSDPEKNTVAVGKVVKDVLEKAGIPTVHLTEQFDRDNWSEAYNNSSSAVNDILKKNPSIQYVIDIHRDCIGNDESGYVRTICEEDKKATAQLMFVCGTDEGGSGHTQWRSNLTFALQLQSLLFSENSALMRPVNLRRASFYQDCSPSSLILECGTCANSLTEAKRGAVLFACSLADYIYGDSCGLSQKELTDSLCP